MSLSTSLPLITEKPVICLIKGQTSLNDSSHPVKSIGQVLADPKLAASVKKSTKPIINKLNGADLHEALLEYCLTPEQMKLHNYPIPTNESKKVITINDMSRYLQIIGWR